MITNLRRIKHNNYFSLTTPPISAKIPGAAPTAKSLYAHKALNKYPPILFIKIKGNAYVKLCD